MDSPYHFPHPADEIAREAERTRHESVSARLDRLFRLIAAGRALAALHPPPEAGARYKERMEAAWQQAHREIFERYGR